MAEHIKNLFLRKLQELQQYHTPAGSERDRGIYEACAILGAYLKNIPTAETWIRTEDRLPDRELAVHKSRFPEDGILEVIVMIRDAAEPTVLLYDGESFMDLNGELYAVTHWMPLPKPPKSDWKDAMMRTFLGRG